MDVDVPAGPMLFRREGKYVLGIGSKNGSFFLLDPDTMGLLTQRHCCLTTPWATRSRH